MGRGASKLGSSGSSTGSATRTLNSQETLSAFDVVRNNESDTFQATIQVRDIMDTSMVGTQFVLTNGGLFYQFEKASDGKWDVTMGRTRQELTTNKASHDSLNMAAGEVVNCLYKLT